MKKSALACLLLAFLLLPTAAFAASPPTSRLTGGSRWFGFYPRGEAIDMAPLVALESQIGLPAAVISFYTNDGDNYPAGRVDNVAAHGSIPMVTLDFFGLRTQPVSTITNGARDAYLRTWARNAKAHGGDIWLRPFNEMNGEWAPWYGLKAGNTTADVVAAWRHVKQIFAEEGATNVKFVWSVNGTSIPDIPANAIEKYWPGDAYVDLVAMDGYNWGDTQSWSHFPSFGEMFGRGYATITALTDKPLIIGETASTELGGSKADWITDMFQSIPRDFPRIRGFVWFDQNKELDWRVDSSPASLEAFKAGAASWGPLTISKRVSRIGGANRYATAVAISSASFASAESVVIASGLDFADALSAASLAGTLRAPLLLVPGTSVPAEVSDEIARLGATKAVIVGGPRAVSDGVFRTLAGQGLSVQRAMGANRYGTAADAARRTAQAAGGAGVATVIVARGDSFADALSISPTAYRMSFPILLVRPGSVPAETLQALRDLAPERIILVGGPSAVSTEVEAVLRTSAEVVRLGGTDRYATSAAVTRYVLEQGWAQPAHVGLATGNTFPDALGGGAACGSKAGVLLLTRSAALPEHVSTFLDANEPDVVNVSIYGGPSAVSAYVQAVVGGLVP